MQRSAGRVLAHRCCSSSPPEGDPPCQLLCIKKGLVCLIFARRTDKGTNAKLYSEHALEGHKHNLKETHRSHKQRILLILTDFCRFTPSPSRSKHLAGADFWLLGRATCNMFTIQDFRTRPQKSGDCGHLHFHGRRGSVSTSWRARARHPIPLQVQL